MLIAIEGIDGAGKHTLTTALHDHLIRQGKTVALLSFPRYRQSLPAELVEEALHGHHGDLHTSTYAMALLFALDRADACEHLKHLVAHTDIVLVDRYVASNAAYSAARLHQDGDGQVVDWIEQLEYQRFGLPRPDRQIFLHIPVDLARQRAQQRSEDDATRLQDTYEHDESLQQRTAQVYAQLAQREFGGIWKIVHVTEDRDQLIEESLN